MSPDLLFDQNVERAEDLAEKLCWMYKVSGALAYREEAASEARMALWRQACKFDPRKQVIQCRKSLAREQCAIWDVLMGTSPIYEFEDPYKNFWISSVKRIRGSVLDFFRSERLIIKRSLHQELSRLTPGQIDTIKKRLWAKEEESVIASDFGIDPSVLKELKPTMLHQERFLSMDRNISDASRRAQFPDGGETFGDMLPSSARTDAGDDQKHLEYRVEQIKLAAHLSAAEYRALSLCYHIYDYTPLESAQIMGMTRPALQRLLDGALSKMREAAVPELTAG